MSRQMIVLLVGISISGISLKSQAHVDYDSYYNVTRTTGVVSYEKTANKNIEILDPYNPVRDQDAVGSCQSFAFLGVIENDLFREQGITLDLSERFHLLGSFTKLGSMGAQPREIHQFPELIEEWGVLPETSYPYSQVVNNSAVFALDSAQGISSNGQPAILQAIEGLDEASRFEVLQRPEFLGELPDDKAEVQLPVNVIRQDLNFAKRYLFDERNQIETECFTTQTTPDTRVKVSAQEFAKHCLKHKPNSYLSSASAYLFERFDAHLCSRPEGPTELSNAILAKNAEGLEQVLKNLVAERASMLAFSVPEPIEQRISVLWQNKNTKTTAGHAVVALGYITGEDLLNINNQNSRVLGSGLFDELAQGLDSKYLAPESTASLQTKMQIRSDSLLGRAAIHEQGLLIVRNSWGALAGLDGYQAYTFEYFISNGMMVATKQTPALESDLSFSLQIPAELKQAAVAAVEEACRTITGAASL